MSQTLDSEQIYIEDSTKETIHGQSQDSLLNTRSYLITTIVKLSSILENFISKETPKAKSIKKKISQSQSMHDEDYNPQDSDAMQKNSKKIKKSSSFHTNLKPKRKRKIPGEPPK